MFNKVVARLKEWKKFRHGSKRRWAVVFGALCISTALIPTSHAAELGDVTYVSNKSFVTDYIYDVSNFKFDSSINKSEIVEQSDINYLFSDSVPILSVLSTPRRYFMFTGTQTLKDSGRGFYVNFYSRETINEEQGGIYKTAYAPLRTDNLLTFSYIKPYNEAQFNLPLFTDIINHKEYFGDLYKLYGIKWDNIVYESTRTLSTFKSSNMGDIIFLGTNTGTGGINISKSFNSTQFFKSYPLTPANIKKALNSWDTRIRDISYTLSGNSAFNSLSLNPNNSNSIPNLNLSYSKEVGTIKTYNFDHGKFGGTVCSYINKFYDGSDNNSFVGGDTLPLNTSLVYDFDRLRSFFGYDNLIAFPVTLGTGTLTGQDGISITASGLLDGKQTTFYNANEGFIIGWFSRHNAPRVNFFQEPNIDSSIASLKSLSTDTERHTVTSFDTEEYSSVHMNSLVSGVPLSLSRGTKIDTIVAYGTSFEPAITGGPTIKKGRIYDRKFKIQKVETGGISSTTQNVTYYPYVITEDVNDYNNGYGVTFIFKTPSGEQLFDDSGLPHTARGSASYMPSPITKPLVIPGQTTYSTLYQPASVFTVDKDSYSEVTLEPDGTVLTTIRELNPPVKIDFNELNIDLTAPSATITRSTTDPVSSNTGVTLTVSAIGDDLHTKPIGFEGSWYDNGYSKPVTKNGTYTFTVRDQVGNSREYNVTVDNIDTKAPLITSLTKSTNIWTRQLTITATGSDDVTNPNDLTYEYSFVAQNANGTFTTATAPATNAKKYTTTIPQIAVPNENISGNGTLFIRAKDKIGNYSSWSRIDIENIDTTAPTSISLTQDSGTVNQSIGKEVKVVASDNSNGSGLHDKPYRWTVDGVTSDWTSNTIQSIKKPNSVVKVEVRDMVGNIASKSLTVSGISTTDASVTLSKATVSSARSVELKAVPSLPTGIILANSPYSWDGGKTWSNVSTKTVESNGEYTVLIKTSDGGVFTSNSLSVTEIDRTPPTGSISYSIEYPIVNGVKDTEASLDECRKYLLIEAYDTSGQEVTVTLNGNNQSFRGSPVNEKVEIDSPGVYSITVTDAAGNRNATPISINISNDAIWGSNTGNGSNTQVTAGLPDGQNVIGLNVNRTAIVGAAPSGNIADISRIDNISDLVYSIETHRVYDKPNNKLFTHDDYITFLLAVNKTKGDSLLEGTAEFAGKQGTVTFGTEANNATSESPYRGTQRNLIAKVRIPLAGINDIQNGTVRVNFVEKKNGNVIANGGYTTTTSVVKSTPTVNQSFVSATNELVVTATSPIAKANDCTVVVKQGSTTITPSNGVYTLSPTRTGNVTITVTDKTGNQTVITKTLDQLRSQSGGSVPVTQITDPNLGVQYQSGVGYESYILGSSKSNTDSAPTSDFLNGFTN